MALHLSRRSVGVAGATIAVLAVGMAPAQAVAGNDVPEGAYRFTAHLTDGSAHGCTGTLVAAHWLLTARECVESPAGPLTAVIGKADLGSSAGHERGVSRVVAHPTLNLALVRLSAPVTDITVPVLRTTAPAAGQELTLLGYGQTATQWVPRRLHGVKVAVGTVAAQSADVDAVTSGAPTTCKGDAGGPAIRESGGSVELVGVHGAAWQGGCLGETETRTGAVEVRVDVAADWIATTVKARPRTDFNGDGKADIAGIDKNKDLRLYIGDGAGRLSGGSAMWATGGLWAGFHGIA
jgi:secreted trypsin-like serine protease